MLNEISFWNLQVPKESNFPMEEFLSIGFTHHRTILSKVKDKDARLFYIRRCYKEKFNVESLPRAITRDGHHRQGNPLKTSADMSEELKKALPDIEELKKMLKNDEK